MSHREDDMPAIVHRPTRLWHPDWGRLWTSPVGRSRVARMTNDPAAGTMSGETQ
jgi:hypothetical protein